MRFLQIVAILAVALLGAVPVPGVEARPDAHNFHAKYVKPPPKLDWAYADPANTRGDESIKRDPRFEYRAIPPAKRAGLAIPSTSKLDNIYPSPQQHHRIDISDREYDNKNKNKKTQKEKRRSSSSSRGLTTEGYLNTRVDGEMFPSAPEPVKARSGWKVLSRADKEEEA